MKNNLKERALGGFNVKFRDVLCNAVQVYVLNGWKICSAIQKTTESKCPEGCLFKEKQYPIPYTVQKYYGFKWSQHYSFQEAFDKGLDDGTPEAALGLLYRNKFVI